MVPRMMGLMVACCTLGSMWIVTSPPRCIMPKTGGFSFSSVLRPRSPFRRRRRPLRPFFYGAGLALMPSRHVRLIALDGAAQLDFGPVHHDAFAELAGHLLDIADTQIQLRGDLLIGQVQPHEIQTQDPGRQGLVVAREDGLGEIVETAVAVLAAVALAVWLGFVAAVLGDVLGRASRARDPVGPAQLPHGFKALGVVDEVFEVDHGWAPGVDSGYRTAITASNWRNCSDCMGWRKDPLKPDMSLSEYTDRYPDHAEEIRDLFPALVMMERIAP